MLGHTALRSERDHVCKASIGVPVVSLFANVLGYSLGGGVGVCLVGLHGIRRSVHRERYNSKKSLIKGLFRSYVLEYRKNRGKLFLAQNGLLRKDEATKFPSMTGHSLSGVALSLPLPRPSLMLISLTGSGMAMCDEYRKQLEGEFGDKVGVVELSLLDKAVFMWMRNWIERNLKRDVSSYRHDGFMVCTGKMALELRQALSIHSSMVGYAFLLDGEGLIRWRAHATPTQEELQWMTKCTQLLCNLT